MKIGEIANKKYKELTDDEFEFYQNHIEDIFIYKIENKIRFSEDELENLIHDTPDDIIEDVQESESLDRWSRNVVTIFKIKNRYFKIPWDEGLTEYQDNSYNYQPEEVKKHEKQITIIEWEEI